MAMVVGGELPDGAAKYYEALRASPAVDALFDRFTRAWREERSGGEMREFLRKEAESGGRAADWAILARALAEAGEDAAALEAYGRALSADEVAAWMRIERARLLRRLGRHAEAVEEALRVPPEHPLRVEAVALAGRSLLRERRADEAMVLWRAAVERRPEDTYLLEDLTALCRRAVRTEEAREFAGRRVEVERDPLARERARLEVAALWMRDGETDKATATWRRVLGASGTGSWLEKAVLDAVENSFSRRGMDDRLAELLAAWTGEMPGRPELRKRHAHALAAAAKWDAALAVVTEWLRRVPGEREALRLRVDLLEKAGRDDEAWAALGHLSARFPDEREYRRERIEMAFRQERKDGLRGALREFTASAESDAERVRIGDIWARCGLREEAEDLWKRLAEGEAGAAADRALADFYRREGDREAERDVLLRLAGREDGAHAAEAARGLMRAGAASEALEILSAGDANTPERAGLRTRAARLAGDAEAERRAARRWLRLAGEAGRAGEVARAVDAVMRVEDRAESLPRLRDQHAKTPAERCLLATWLREGSDAPLSEATLDGLLTGTGADGEMLRDFRLILLKRDDRWEEAARFLAESGPEAGGEVSHFRQLGDLWRGAGRLDEARAAYRRWRAAAPDSAAAWKAEAGMISRADPEAAERLLRRALARFGEDDAGLGHMLLNLLERAGERAGAFELAWDRYLREPDAWRDDLIESARRANRENELRGRLEERARVRAASPEPPLMLAELAQRTSGAASAEAGAHLAEALRRAPENRAVWRRLARLREARGEREKAIARWEAMAERWPGPRSARDLCEARLRNGQIARGLREWTALERGSGGGVDPRRCEEAAMGVAQAGYLTEAVDFLRGLERDAASEWLLAKLLAGDGRETEAAEVFLRIVRAEGGEFPGGILPGSGGRRQPAEGMRGAIQSLASSGARARSATRVALTDFHRELDRLLPTAPNADEAADASARELVVLGVRMGGEVWEMARGAFPVLARASRDEWRTLWATSDTSEWVRRWRANPDSELFARMVITTLGFRELALEERERVLAAVNPETPAEELRVRVVLFRRDAPERVVAWIERVGPEAVPVSGLVDAVWRLAGGADVDFRHRLEALLPDEAELDDEEQRRYLNLRVGLAKDAGLPAGDMVRRLRKLWAFERTSSGTGTSENARRVFARRDANGLGPSLPEERMFRSFASGAGGAGDLLRGDAELRRRVGTPLFRCWLMRDEEEFEATLKRARAELAEDERARAVGMTMIEWSRKAERDGVDALEEAITREIERRPAGRLSRFGIALRVREAVENGALEDLEEELRRAEEQGVAIESDLVFWALSPGFRELHGAFRWRHHFQLEENEASRILPKLAEVMKTWMTRLRTRQGGRLPTHTVASTPARRALDLGLNRWSHRASETLRNADENRAAELGLQMLANAPDGSSVAVVVNRLERLKVEPTAVFRRLPRPTPEDGLADCRRWIQTADAVGEDAAALELVRTVAVSRPWDAAWRLERMVREASAGARDTALRLARELVGEAPQYSGLLANCLRSIEPASLFAVTDVLLEASDGDDEAPWLGTLCQSLTRRIRGKGDEAENARMRMLRVARRMVRDPALASAAIRELSEHAASLPGDEVAEAMRTGWLNLGGKEKGRAGESRVRLRPRRHESLAGGAVAAAWLVRHADQVGADSAFPPEFRTELARRDEMSGEWLGLLLAAEHCSELPAPLPIYAGNEDRPTLVEALRSAVADEADHPDPLENPIGLGPAVARAESLPGRVELFQLMSDPEGDRVAPVLTPDFRMAMLEEAVSAGALEELLDPWIRATRERAGSRGPGWLKSLGRPLRFDIRLCAAVTRAFSRARAPLSIPFPTPPPALKKDPAAWLRKGGLLGDVATVAEFGRWLSERNAPAAPDDGEPDSERPALVFGWSGRSTYLQAVRGLSRDEREAIPAPQEPTFGEGLFMMLSRGESPARIYRFLAGYDREIGALPEPVATAMLGALLPEIPAEGFSKLGPRATALMEARLDREGEAARAELRRVAGVWKDGDSEELNRAIRSMRNSSLRQYAPEEWMAAFRAFLDSWNSLQPDLRTSHPVRAMVGAMLRDADADTLRDVLDALVAFPQARDPDPNHSMMQDFWRQTIQSGDAELLRDCLERTLAIESRELRRDILFDWIAATRSWSWRGDPWPSEMRESEIGRVLDCLRGAIVIDEGPLVNLAYRSVHRLLARIAPPEDGSERALALLASSRLSRNTEGPEYLEELCRRRRALEGVSERTDARLIEVLDGAARATGETVELSEVEGIVPALRRVVGNLSDPDERTASELRRLIVGTRDREFMEAMVRRAGESDEARELRYELALEELRVGEVRAAAERFSRLDSGPLDPRGRERRFHRYEETRGRLDLADPEQRDLALRIDLMGGQPVGEEFKPQSLRRVAWLRRMNRDLPDHPREFAVVLWGPGQCLTEPSPLLEAVVGNDPVGACRKWLAAREEGGTGDDVEEDSFLDRDLAIAAACSRALGGDFGPLAEIGKALEDWPLAPYEQVLASGIREKRRTYLGIETTVCAVFWAVDGEDGLGRDARSAAEAWARAFASAGRKLREEEGARRGSAPRGGAEPRREATLIEHAGAFLSAVADEGGPTPFAEGRAVVLPASRHLYRNYWMYREIAEDPAFRSLFRAAVAMQQRIYSIDPDADSGRRFWNSVILQATHTMRRHGVGDRSRSGYVLPWFSRGAVALIPDEVITRHIRKGASEFGEGEWKRVKSLLEVGGLGIGDAERADLQNLLETHWQDEDGSENAR